MGLEVQESEDPGNKIGGGKWKIRERVIKGLERAGIDQRNSWR